jgi:hypothetical protein
MLTISALTQRNTLPVREVRDRGAVKARDVVLDAMALIGSKAAGT